VGAVVGGSTVEAEKGGELVGYVGFKHGKSSNQIKDTLKDVSEAIFRMV